jgi:hypothetical protein
MSLCKSWRVLPRTQLVTQLQLGAKSLIWMHCSDLEIAISFLKPTLNFMWVLGVDIMMKVSHLSSSTLVDPTQILTNSSYHESPAYYIGLLSWNITKYASYTNIFELSMPWCTLMSTITGRNLWQILEIWMIEPMKES